MALRSRGWDVCAGKIFGYLTGYDLGDVEHEAQGPLLRKPVTEEKLLRVIEDALAVSPPRPTPN